LAMVVLGETMGPWQLCGGVLILLAAVTLIRSETRKPGPDDPHSEGSTEREAALLGQGNMKGAGHDPSTTCHNYITPQITRLGKP